VLASEAEVACCLGIALVVVAVIVRVSRWVPACAGTTVRGACGVTALLGRPFRQSASVTGGVFGVHPRGEFRTSERPKAK
jgi:hypothetical protein